MNKQCASYAVAIKKDKLGNCFKKVISKKSDFKTKERKGVGYEANELWVCVKSYKVGTKAQLEKFCSQPKNKKNSIIVNPMKEEIWCVKSQSNVAQVIMEGESDEKVSRNNQFKKLVKMVESLKASIYQWKERLRNSTEEILDVDLNPVKQEEEMKVVESYNKKGKKISLKPVSVFGLYNIGNTCFFNSIMQCLNANNQFVAHYIMNKDVFLENAQYCKFGNINLKLSQLFTDARSSNKSAISPKGFFKSIIAIDKKYATYSQQDASELFRLLLDALTEGELAIMRSKKQLSKTKTLFKKIESPTQKLFCGYLGNNVRCLHHEEYNDWTFDLLSDLILDIETEAEEQAAASAGNAQEDWANETNHNKKRKKKKKNKKKKQKEIQGATNVLGDLMAEEFTASKFSEEKQEARRNFENMLFNEGLDAQDGYNELNPDFKGDKIPGYDPEEDSLWNPTQFQRVPGAATEGKKLDDLLKNNFSTKLLNNMDNYYACPLCRKDESVDLDSEIRFSTLCYRLYQPPDNLVITLKRFKQKGRTRGYGGYGSVGFKKNNTHVQFSFELDLSKYVLSRNTFGERYVYDLYGIVSHNGSMGGGHYVAYCKHQGTNGEDQWFYFSDASHHQVGLKEVLKVQAYMLFYKRRFLDKFAGATLPKKEKIEEDKLEIDAIGDDLGIDVVENEDQKDLANILGELAFDNSD